MQFENEGQNMFQIFCVFVIVLSIPVDFIYGINGTSKPPCSSRIVCDGPILKTVQMARIFNDSKIFVDLKLKQPPNVTLENFNALLNANNHTLNLTQIKDFVMRSFDPFGEELENCKPADWKVQPEFLNRIYDVELKNWANDLHGIWNKLCRKIKDDVLKEIDLYSIIWVPNSVIVPGGRFREFYYWDSYWIIRGLLISEMNSTVKGMLENFFYIVNHYGHIPNGGRIYYLQRSQPPLLIPMVKSYLNFTNDIDFVVKNVQTMENEFKYWMTNHTRIINVNGTNYTLAFYGENSNGPRPESYWEDSTMANGFETDEEKQDFFKEVKSAAESGWDFSSRWFIRNGTNKGNLTDTKIRSIVPVDLNAILYWNAMLLSEFFALANNMDKMQEYRDLADQWLKAVTDVLWDEDVGVWLDYDMINSKRRNYFYPSNASPLFTGCYNKTIKEHIANSVVKYLQMNEVLLDGGVPTSFEGTKEQWDYPNAWPPLQHILIVGLKNTGIPIAEQFAFNMTKIWIESVYSTYNLTTSKMYEKYDAIYKGGRGTGGEYEVQIGFGWTNGVILDLLNMYGTELEMEKPKSLWPSKDPFRGEPLGGDGAGSLSSFSQITTALIAFLMSSTAGFIG